MPEAIENQIAELARLSGDGLRQRFEEAFGKAPGLRTSAELLRLALAYRLQEEAESGLSPRMRSVLKRLESRLQEGKPVLHAQTVRLKPGTRLVRVWKGERHQVTVLEQGSEYLGRRHSNLSVIAREIADSPWSGPAFFGLKQKRHVPPVRTNGALAFACELHSKPQLSSHQSAIHLSIESSRVPAPARMRNPRFIKGGESCSISRSQRSSQ